MKKLGETESAGGTEWILTGRFFMPTYNGVFRIETWTPIPDGMSPSDLGTKFRAASSVLVLDPIPSRESIERLEPE